MSLFTGSCEMRRVGDKSSRFGGSDDNWPGWLRLSDPRSSQASKLVTDENELEIRTSLFW